MAEVTMEELKKFAAKLTQRVEAIANESDPDKFIAMAKEIEAEAKAFEAMGAEYVKAQQGRIPVQPMATVVLTKDQRKKVLDETGIVMETLQLADDGGLTSQTMPEQTLKRIEFLALEEAKRRKQAAVANTQAIRQVNDAVADLEAVGNPALMELLERNKENPNFLGGLLSKKK